MGVCDQQVFFDGAERAAAGDAVPGAGPGSVPGWIWILQQQQHLQHPT